MFQAKKDGCIKVVLDPYNPVGSTAHVYVQRAGGLTDPQAEVRRLLTVPRVIGAMIRRPRNISKFPLSMARRSKKATQ